MAEKDLSEKTLEYYSDVFADILNGFLFDGEQVVKPDELTPADVLSQYKTDGKLHEQERDVSKYWQNGTHRFDVSLFGLENQSDTDRYMSMRVIGYNGADYQRLLKSGNYKSNSGLYPAVFTIVLYFGKTEWKYGTELKDCVNIDERLRPYFWNYGFTLIDFTKVGSEDVPKFRSDFKQIVKMYADINEGREYTPLDDVLLHPMEIADFFRVFRRDDRFIEAVNKAINEKKGGVTMCDIVDSFEKKGFDKGIEKGIEREKANTIKELLNVGRSISEIADFFKTSEDEIKRRLDIVPQ